MLAGIRVPCCRADAHILQVWRWASLDAGLSEIRRADNADSIFLQLLQWVAAVNNVSHINNLPTSQHKK